MVLRLPLQEPVTGWSLLPALLPAAAGRSSRRTAKAASDGDAPTCVCAVAWACCFAAGAAVLQLCCLWQASRTRCAPRSKYAKNTPH